MNISFFAVFANVWKATNTAYIFSCVNDKRTTIAEQHTQHECMTWNCSVNYLYIVEAIDHDRLQTKWYTIESDQIRSIHFDNFDHEITTTNSI